MKMVGGGNLTANQLGTFAFVPAL